MRRRTCLAIVLAAGEGKRMRSRLPKVLHPIAGRSLLAHALLAADVKGARLAVVTSPRQAAIAEEARRIAPDAQVFVQKKPRGTADAVKAASAALRKRADDVLVLFGDTPLIRPETLVRLRQAIADGAAVAVLGFRPVNPTGYGRLVVIRGDLEAIREENDASPAERAIALCNGGLMAFDGKHALTILNRIGNANSKKEFYLTDAVAIARQMGLRAAAIEVDEDEVRGINTKTQLAEAEAVMQRRLRAAAMESGVTMMAPDTVHMSADTKFGSDVTIEPHVVFGTNVVVGDGAVIRAFSHIEGARIGDGARVGPYARLRPGADLGTDVHIGNFVEVKAARIGKGAKANHLTYIGDSRIGEGTNVGAGTITCNYDGTHKHLTEIGKGAFIGSNSSLVAPVKIGDRAYIGSGSVITVNVPADALAFERSPVVVKKGWVKRKPARKASAKKKR